MWSFVHQSSSIVNSRMQSRQDLQVLLRIGVLSVFRNLSAHARPLLLRLPDLNPLFGRKVLAELREGVSSKAKPIQQRAILDRIEHYLVIGSRKVQNTQAVDVRLVSWRRVYSVYTTLDQAARQCRQRVTSVDRDCAVLRFHPLPLALRVQDLQRCYRLAEQQRYGTEVRVAGPVQVAYLLVLFGAARCIVHVPKVVFPLHVIQVVPDQLVLVGELQ